MAGYMMHPLDLNHALVMHSMMFRHRQHRHGTSALTLCNVCSSCLFAFISSATLCCSCGKDMGSHEGAAC